MGKRCVTIDHVSGCCHRVLVLLAISVSSGVIWEAFAAPPWWSTFTLLFTGLLGFLLIVVAILLGVAIVRVVAIELAKFYFDYAPEKRYEILNGMSFAADERRVQANIVLSAMLRQQTTALRLGSELLVVQDGMVGSQEFIAGAYGKGWNRFLDIFVLCFALVGIFGLLLSIP
jgi:hypothetical protein